MGLKFLRTISPSSEIATSKWSGATACRIASSGNNEAQKAGAWIERPTRTETSTQLASSTRTARGRQDRSNPGSPLDIVQHNVNGGGSAAQEILTIGNGSSKVIFTTSSPFDGENLSISRANSVGDLGTGGRAGRGGVSAGTDHATAV